MKTRILLILAALVTVVAIAADNEGSSPKFFPGNENQVRVGSVEVSGSQISKAIITNSAGVALGSASTVNSTAYEPSRIFKVTPGALVSLSGFNNSASAQFIQIHNAIALPIDGAAPIAFFTVPAASNFSFSFPTPLTMSVGITICRSSTGPTKTIGAGAADVWFYGQIQ